MIRAADRVKTAAPGQQAWLPAWHRPWHRQHTRWLSWGSVQAPHLTAGWPRLPHVLQRGTDAWQRVPHGTRMQQLKVAMPQRPNTFFCLMSACVRCAAMRCRHQQRAVAKRAFATPRHGRRCQQCHEHHARLQYSQLDHGTDQGRAACMSCSRGHAAAQHRKSGEIDPDQSTTKVWTFSLTTETNMSYSYIIRT